MPTDLEYGVSRLARGRMGAMRCGPCLAFVALVAAGTLTAAPPVVQNAGLAAASRLDVQKVANGVYAAIRTEPPGLMFDANSVFIINDADVIVVDTNITPSSARASLAALMKLTTKPVTAVINTHWHDDHIIGNQVYRDAFPSAEFIAQASAAQDLPTTGESNRKRLIAAGPQMVTQLQMSVEQHKSLTGNPLTDDEQTSYLSDIALVKRYLDEAPVFQIVMPTRLVETQLSLSRGTRKIEVLFLGRAHTAADLVVWLADDRVAITGALVTSPIPLVGSTSHPLEFGATAASV